MRWTLAILTVLFLGCDEPPRIAPVPPPVVRPDTDFKGIVLVTMNGCRWCDKQKRVLDEMRVTYLPVNHSEDPSARQKYPASSYPTMYVYYKRSPTRKLEGFKDRVELDRIIR